MRFLKMGVLACAAAAAACSSSTTSPVTIPVDAGAIPDAVAAIPDAVAAVQDAVAAVQDAVAAIRDSGVPDVAAPQEAAAAAATFTQVYNGIISPICVQCHNPAGIGVSMGHLDMSTKAAAFTDLVGVEAAGIFCGGMGTRVVAGNAANSIMFKKIDPAQPSPCGSKMPLGLPPLTAAQAGEIQSWINAGALND
jgi:mono/diheme cytochrome c family protein